MFSTLSKTEIIIYITFILSSANAFNLDQVKFLSSGDGLIGTRHHCDVLSPSLLEQDRNIMKTDQETFQTTYCQNPARVAQL